MLLILLVLFNLYKEIGELCKKNSIYFILDSAQSAGVLEVDFKKFNLNALAFTGHKSFLVLKV